MEEWHYDAGPNLGRQRRPGESYRRHFYNEQQAPFSKRRRAESYPPSVGLSDEGSRTSSKASCVLCRVVLSSNKDISEHLSSKEHYEMMCRHPGMKVEDTLIPESITTTSGDDMFVQRPGQQMGNRPRSRTAQGPNVGSRQALSQKSQLSFQISESDLQLARQLNFDTAVPHPPTPGSSSSNVIPFLPQRQSMNPGSGSPRQQRKTPEPFQLRGAGQRELREPRKSAFSTFTSPHGNQSRMLHSRNISGASGSQKQAAKKPSETLQQENDRAKAKTSPAVVENDVKESLIRCKACNIVVPNQFHWEAHVGSKKHLENLRKAEAVKARQQEEEQQVVREEEMKILEKMRAEEEEGVNVTADWEAPKTELRVSEELKREVEEKSEVRAGSSQLQLSPQVSGGSRPPTISPANRLPEDPNMEIHIELRCGLCKVVVQNRAFWEAHTQSPLHQKALASAGQVLSTASSPLAMFYCSVCSTFSNTEKMFAEHVTGRRHKENLKRKPGVSPPKMAKNRQPNEKQTAWNTLPMSQQHVTSSTLLSKPQLIPSLPRILPPSRVQIQEAAREGSSHAPTTLVQKQVVRKVVEPNPTSSNSAAKLTFSLQRLQKQLLDASSAKVPSSSRSDPAPCAPDVKISQPATSTTVVADSGEKESSKARGERCITPVLPPEPSAAEDPAPKRKRVIRLKRPRSRDSSIGTTRGSSSGENHRSGEKQGAKRRSVSSNPAPPQPSSLTSSRDFVRLQLSPPTSKPLPDSSGMESHVTQHSQALKEISPASTSVATSSRPAVARRIIRIKRSSGVAQDHPRYDSDFELLTSRSGSRMDESRSRDLIPPERRARRSMTPQFPQSTQDHFREAELQRIGEGYGETAESNEEEGYLEIHPDTPDFEQYYGQDFTLPLFRRPGDEQPRCTQPQNRGGGDVEYCDGGSSSTYGCFDTNFSYNAKSALDIPEGKGFHIETSPEILFGGFFSGTSGTSPAWAEHHPRFGPQQQPQSQSWVSSSEVPSSFDSPDNHRSISGSSGSVGRDQRWGSHSPSFVYRNGNRILADDSGRPRPIHTVNYHHGFMHQAFPNIPDIPCALFQHRN